MGWLIYPCPWNTTSATCRADFLTDQQKPNQEGKCTSDQPVVSWFHVNPTAQLALILDLKVSVKAAVWSFEKKVDLVRKFEWYS